MAYTTIKKPSDYFNTKLYTGNGGTLVNTDVGFQPDLVWLKVRSNADNHCWFDSVRGVQKRLASNLSAAESNRATALTSFDSDGFTLGDNSESNTENYTYASWNWKANGAGSANTDGTITSTVSANTTSGFSIVKYTGDGNQNSTVGHGLGTAPKFIVIKHINDTVGWNTRTYHSSLSANQSLYINDTAGASTIDAYGGISSVGVNTFGFASISSNPSFNAVNSSNSINYIAYCFSDVKGYSKFGSYAGNQNTDGTFVYLGFKPAFVMIKRYSAGNPTATNWQMFDSKRLGYNVDNNQLQANLSNAEGTDDDLDILSNGFKLRGTGADLNNSGHNYIYMAFAEQPLVGDNPATAR